jgi:hypothetical protein
MEVYHLPATSHVEEIQYFQFPCQNQQDSWERNIF